MTEPPASALPGRDPPQEGRAWRLDVLVAVLMVTVAALWFSLFSPAARVEPVDLAMEVSYLAGALVAGYFVATWNERSLVAGWLLFTVALELEVLDEFTLEPAFWNLWLPFSLGVMGLALVGVGFARHTARHGREAADRAARAAFLEQSLVTLRAVIDGTPDVVTVRDLEGRHVLVNAAAARVAGMPEAAMLGRTGAELFPGGGSALSENDVRVLETGDTVTSEESFPFDGTTRTFLVTTCVYRDRRGFALGILRQGRDITERKRAEERLAHDASHDVLTGLPNRARLVEELEVAMSRVRRNPDHLFAVLFLDLDRFKVINDSLGHSVGDELLTTFARTLRGWLRPSDVVARMGGDEFVVLLDGIDSVDHATRVAERIGQGLRAALKVGGREIFVQSSVGIALSSTGYERADDVLRDADLALYRAKTAGRGRYALFDVGLHERAMARLQLETDLRRAVERMEFRVAYQPIVSLTSRRLVGFEALLRWQHPTRGLLLPADFLEVADDTGLMVPLGSWVLREALGRLASWERELPEARSLTISVNVSSRQLVHPQLIEFIQEALQGSGLEPGRLRIEVTESVIMEHTEAAVARLVELRSLGVLLDMDDFGTGYSSLSHLQRFPLQAVKIDRSFIERMRGGEETEIVQAILTLGLQLGLDVVAEGVETGEQQAALAAMGCPHAQGYLFSHPVFAEEAAQLIGSGLGVS